jgi:hypothetical protein
VLVYLTCKHRNTTPTQGQFKDLPTDHGAAADVQRGLVAERIITRVPDRLPARPPRDPGARRQHRSLGRHRRKACEEWAAKGYPISYIHRDNREGYKAGALARGMKTRAASSSRSSMPTSFPRATSCTTSSTTFTDDKIGMVQVPLGSSQPRTLAADQEPGDLPRRPLRHRAHRPQPQRPLHALQRHRRRLAPHDHRRRGGWQHDTLTEDLDLSYRAQMKGWQFVYLPQFCAPAELPPEMIGFKQQAHRWTKGSASRTAIKLLPHSFRIESTCRCA